MDWLTDYKIPGRQDWPRPVFDWLKTHLRAGSSTPFPAVMEALIDGDLCGCCRRRTRW